MKFLCLKFDEVRDPAPFKDMYYFFLLRFFSNDEGRSLSKGIQTERSLTTYHWKICPKETKVLHLQLNAVQVMFKNTSPSHWSVSIGSGGGERGGGGVEGGSEGVRLSFYF